MIVPQVTLSMDVTKVDAQAFEFFVNPIQSQNLQIWQGYHLSIFKSYVFLQNLEGIAQELNMRLLGYCGRWISHEGPLQGSGTSIIPNSDPPSSLSSRTTLLVPVLVERFPYLQLPAGAEFLNNGTLYPPMKQPTRQHLFIAIGKIQSLKSCRSIIMQNVFDILELLYTKVITDSVLVFSKTLILDQFFFFLEEKNFL